MKVFHAMSEQINAEIATAIQLAKDDIKLAHNENAKKKFTFIKTQLLMIQTAYSDLVSHENKVFKQITTINLHELEVLIQNIEKKHDQLSAISMEILHVMEEFSVQEGLEAEQKQSAARLNTAIIFALILAIGILFSWVISANITKRLSTLSKGLELVASGDLSGSVIVDGKDDISRLQQSMKTMQKNLSEMISNISSTSIQLSATSEEVSVTMGQTASNVQTQQIETQQIATDMSEMSTAISDVSATAVETSDVANEANDKVIDGQRTVQNAISGVHQLSKQIDNASKVIDQVALGAQEINTVLDVIKGIAEQTNLLALNAAIEAARAGEQGRGFAVVADEVRTLASRTQDSTTEINSIIERLQAEAKNATQVMSASREQGMNVVDLATSAGVSLDEITKLVEKILDKSTQIASSVEMQNTVAKNMDSSVNQINQLAMQNAASIEQTSVAGNEIASNASELQVLVERFNLR